MNTTPIRSFPIVIATTDGDRPFLENAIIPSLKENGCTPTIISDLATVDRTVDFDSHSADLEACVSVIVVISSSTVSSPLVKEVIHWAAWHRPSRLIPLLIEDCDLYDIHPRIARLQCLDVRNRDNLESHLLQMLDLYRGAKETERDEPESKETETRLLRSELRFVRICTTIAVVVGCSAGAASEMIQKDGEPTDAIALGLLWACLLGAPISLVTAEILATLRLTLRVRVLLAVFFCITTIGAPIAFGIVSYDMLGVGTTLGAIIGWMAGMILGTLPWLPFKMETDP